MGKLKRKYTRREKPSTPEPALYELTVQVGDKQYFSKGKTIAEALRNIERPQKITTKGFLFLKYGDKKFERAFRPQDLRRFLWPVSAVINAKVISIALK